MIIDIKNDLINLVRKYGIKNISWENMVDECRDGEVFYYQGSLYFDTSKNMRKEDIQFISDILYEYRCELYNHNIKELSW